MNKIINFSKSVSEICTQYPEMIEILKELGFDSLSTPMLATAGRFMTIPKGANMKKLDLTKIKESLFLRGYEVIE